MRPRPVRDDELASDMASSGPEITVFTGAIESLWYLVLININLNIIAYITFSICMCPKGYTQPLSARSPSYGPEKIVVCVYNISSN
jgi:hypothetical protein